MKTNRELQDAVIEQLRWEPRVDASAIGVSAIAGSVTLTGHASSYAQKLDAVRAAERVDGVTAVADELEVHLSGDPRDDAREPSHEPAVPPGRQASPAASSWAACSMRMRRTSSIACGFPCTECSERTTSSESTPSTCALS